MKRYTRARPNKALPDQDKIFEQVTAQLRAEVRRRGHSLLNYNTISFSMPISLLDVVWSERQGQPYTPPNIERGLRRLTESGVQPELTVEFAFAQFSGGGSFISRLQEKGVIPWKLEIEVRGYPSPSAADTLNHELQHLVQWAGTGLVRIAEAPAGPLDLREMFRIRPGQGGVYGVPRRELRTYYGVEEGRSSGSTQSGAVHSQYDSEFHTNVGSWSNEIIEELFGSRHLTSDQLVEVVNRWFVRFKAREPRLKVDSRRMKRQKEQVFLTVSRRLGVPRTITEDIRLALGTVAPRREGFRKQKERRRKAREAGTLPVRPVADERGIRIGDWVTFMHFGASVKGRVRGEKGGRYIIEQWGDFHDPAPRARRKLVEAGTRWTIPKRNAKKAEPPPRAPRTQQPPPRPASAPAATPRRRSRPTAPPAPEPIFAKLDRKLAALPRSTKKLTYSYVRVSLGLSDPQLLSWIYNAAAVSGADPHFTAEWPYDRDEPVNVAALRAGLREGRQRDVNVLRITFGTKNYVGNVFTSLEGRQTDLIIRRPDDKKASFVWVEAVHAVLGEYGLKGATVIAIG